MKLKPCGRCSACRRYVYAFCESMREEREQRDDDPVIAQIQDECRFEDDGPFDADGRL